MRIHRSITFMAVAALVAGVSRASAQEIWTPEGLESSRIYSLAIGPSGTRYAGTPGGIFRSTEAGVWSLLPGSPANVTALAPDPSDPDTLYTGTYHLSQWGLHKTSDGGQHFERLGTTPVGVRQIAVDPAHPSTLYVGGDHPKVYKSTDAGATFVAPVSPDLVNRIAALVIDPTRPGTVYAGSDQGEASYYYFSYYYAPAAPVMRSVDSGVRWSALFEQGDLSLSRVYVTALAIDPGSGTLYAGAWEDFGQVSMFRTSDAGLHWDRFVLGIVSTVGEIRALVLDPDRPDTIYAATTASGVMRSVDGGSTWLRLNEGLPQLDIGSLVLDSANQVLLAASDDAVFRLRLDQRASVCTPTRHRLCLLGNRYEVVASATNPRTGLASPGVAIAGGDRFGSFSLPGMTGDASLPEVLVKMVDGAPGPPVLLFYGGLTTVSYSVTVTDTVTGHTETYRNDSENRLCGGVDGNALLEPGAWGYVRSAGAERTGLSLLGGRFSVAMSAFSSRHGRTEQGVALPRTDRYGFFSLPGFTGDALLPEVHVKMIDFRSLTGDFLLFHTGLTSLDYTLTVTDQETGETRTFQSHGNYCGGVETLDGH